MTEKPILFNTEMVKAILEGRKTQTRRVIKPQPTGILTWHSAIERWSVERTGKLYKDKYGRPGDRLWVRETCKLFSIAGVDGSETNSEEWTIKYKAGGGLKTVPKQAKPWGSFRKWTPSIFMPRWASRITLEVTDVRVERVNDISAGDIVAEGIEMPASGSTLRTEWEDLWDSINAKRGYGWMSNPWCWVIEFKKI